MAGRAGFLSLVVRTALGLAAVFTLLDLWQVALANPGSLTAGNVLVLGLVYLGGAVVAAGVTFGLAAVCGVDLVARAALLRALLCCGGLLLVFQEVALRALASRSAWRPLAIGGAALLAAGLVPVARVMAGRVRAGLPLVAVVVALLALGALGAVHGFVPRAERMAGRAPDAPVPTGPNVLLVTIDTLRPDHLSCYGYAKPTSPRLDAFAREGVLFTRAFAQSSWTKPSTASLLTSHYPTMHGVNLETSKVSDAETLVFETMAAAGWTTAVLSGNPWITPEYGFDQGVDHFFSIYDERFARVTLLMQVLKRLDKAVEGRPRVYNGLKVLVQGDLSTTARDERLNSEAIRWLATPRTRPFFLYVHYMSPHHPYDPPPPYDTRFNPHPVEPPVTGYPKKSYYFYEQGAALPPAELADIIGRYDGDVNFADAVFGQLMDELRRTGLLDRTLVVVTADHGEEFYDHRNWGHGHSVYNELLQVPLLVRWPAALPQGVRVDQPVMSVDVVPTILALTGVPAPDGLAGTNVVPVAQGGAWPDGDRVYSELIYRYGSGYTLQGAGRKLMETVIGGDTRRSLFDLGSDPGEQRSVLDGRPDGAALASRLADVRDWAERRRIGAAEATITEDMDKRLKALGYVN